MERKTSLDLACQTSADHNVSLLRCMKGYDGERCGIQTLEAVNPRSKQSGKGEATQMVLVIVAVVLSVISCLAILLMSCAQ